MDQETQAYIDQAVEKAVGSGLEAALKKNSKAAIIASKGSLDMAYPPLILATTCAALDIPCQVFFTFYGLDILNKKKNQSLGVPPVGNPAMPVPVPNIIGMLPGMTAMATSMMKGWMGKVGVPTIPELLEMCVESDISIIACQMTMDVMGVKREELIDDIELGGAATFLNYATGCNITLFV
ncbi:MAG: DsrE/DsrF/DrsH-like family protein [Desulfarculaceae bacterium]|nr:DsrE/DsrF/DrsH-like family protein [Desulfarculaceae bacterium]MCF8072475.1 DsrE/DsrF/DrsH-like family protein [Desulfarculaceae bacterium]MCF8102936.1 DsrE/DsrF/DrsH-like family protein [Desulfarculaceae bacterium]MCF8117461.1 DsrE/DsrF/DrsH-like family protein [Desulfarculaceae bacterium]